MNLVFKNTISRIVIILGVISLIYVALSHGLASFKYNYTKNQLEYWSSTDQIPNPVSYQLTKESIRSVNALWPTNPNYIDTRASVLIWGYYEELEDPDILNVAMEHFEQSIRTRPIWPWTWTEWVMTKWRLDEYDDDMLNGLITLDKVGPYTGEANLVLVDVGLQMIAQRPELTAQLKPLIEKHYLRAELNGVIIRQMRALKEEHENTEWLPDLVYWKDRES